MVHVTACRLSPVCGVSGLFCDSQETCWCAAVAMCQLMFVNRAWASKGRGDFNQKRLAGILVDTYRRVSFGQAAVSSMMCSPSCFLCYKRKPSKPIWTQIA